MANTLQTLSLPGDRQMIFSLFFSAIRCYMAVVIFAFVLPLQMPDFVLFYRCVSSIIIYISNVIQGIRRCFLGKFQQSKRRKKNIRLLHLFLFEQAQYDTKIDLKCQTKPQNDNVE